jgi:hypothetical protein
MHRFAPAAERAVQICAILTGAVFLLSGVVYLYLGRVTLMAYTDLWRIYVFSGNHTWLESALQKLPNGHSKFFPSFIWLANLHFLHGDEQMLFFTGLALLFITVLLLLIPVWRDRTISLTAKTVCTLVVILGNFWMGRASITANGGFNCEDSLAMDGAALAFLLIAETGRSWTTIPIIVCAGFLASFSFGTGLAIWPTLLLLAWCLRLPRRTIVVLGISALVAAVIYELLPGLPSFEFSLGNPMGVSTQFCRLLGSPVLYTIAAWRGANTLTDLAQSLSIALWSGVAGLTLAGIVVLPRVRRRDLGKSSLENTGLSLSIFNVFALTLITVGRITYFSEEPSEVIGSRYLFWSSLFWTGLILLGIERAERLQRGRWPTLLLPFAIAIFAWPAHYQAWFSSKIGQIFRDKGATALINAAVETQKTQMAAGLVTCTFPTWASPVSPRLKQYFEEMIHEAAQLRARRLDVFGDGLQDWIGLGKADVFGARHRPEGLRGKCTVDALGQCDNGAPAASVTGQASKHGGMIPRTLVIVDSNGVIRGVARSAPISPFINRTFYQSKLTATIGFVGYIRDYNPELRYAVRSADNLTLSDEEIPVQQLAATP